MILDPKLSLGPTGTEFCRASSGVDLINLSLMYESPAVEQIISKLNGYWF